MRKLLLRQALFSCHLSVQINTLPLPVRVCTLMCLKITYCFTETLFNWLLPRPSPTGLSASGEIYSLYWSDRSIKWNKIDVGWSQTILLLFTEGKKLKILPLQSQYTGCPRRNVPDFGRVFLMLKYTDITQNTYVQSWMVTEIMAREKCGLLVGPRTVPVSWQSYPCPSLSVVSYDSNSAALKHMYFLQGDDVVHVAAALWMVGRLVVRSC